MVAPVTAGNLWVLPSFSFRAVTAFMMADESDADLVVSLAPFSDALTRYTELEVTVEAVKKGWATVGTELSAERLGDSNEDYFAEVRKAKRDLEEVADADVKRLEGYVKAFTDKSDLKYSPKSRRKQQQLLLP